MPMYTDAEMAEERRKRDELANLLIRVGATPEGSTGWRWDPSTASGTKAIRVERDKARDEVEELKQDLRFIREERDAALKRVAELETLLAIAGGEKKPDGLWKLSVVDPEHHRKVVADANALQESAKRAVGQRDDAERALLDAGWTKDPAGPWTPPARPADGVEEARALARAERALTRAGWTYTPGAQEWRPPVGGIAPELVAMLEVIARDVPQGCNAGLTADQVRVVREGVDSLRAARPPSVFDTVDWLNGEVLGVLRSIDNPARAPDAAEREVLRRAVAAVDRLLAAGARIDTSETPEASPAWFASAALVEPEDRGAFTVSRAPDPVSAPRAMARMVALPVLDAVALLAVIDRNAPPYAEGTKAAAALGELEQVVELWLDARAGGA